MLISIVKLFGSPKLAVTFDTSRVSKIGLLNLEIENLL